MYGVERDDILLPQLKTLGEAMGKFKNSTLLRAKMNQVVDGYSPKLRMHKQEKQSIAIAMHKETTEP